MSARPRKQLEWSLWSAQDNQLAADAVIAYMQQRALMLEADPLLGKRLASPRRELVLSRYPFTIIYRVRGGRVVISRVLHQRRQLP